MEYKFENYVGITLKLISKFIHNQKDERFGELFSESYFVFLKTIRLYNKEKNTKFSTYYYIKLKFHIMDYLRKKRKYDSMFKDIKDISLIEDYENSDIIDNIENNCLLDNNILESIKQELTEKQYDIIKLYFIDELSLQDISIKYKTSKQNISQIIKRIKNKYK